jgi:ABC-type Fe3+ transport system substrate-binding protein
MHSALKVIAYVALVQLIGAISPAHAQTSDWKTQWAETLAAAKKEGEVIVATSPNQLRRDFLLKSWAKDFPDIKLSLTSVRGGNFMARVATEREAGKYLWDVFQSGPSSGIQAAEMGLFDPLRPQFLLPEISDPALWGGWDNAFYDEERKYVIGTIGDVVSPYFNAGKVKQSDIDAQGLKVLLDPQYKGKIIWYDPRLDGAGSLFLPLLDRELGRDGLKRLVVDQDPIFVDNLHAVGEAMVRGKALIGLSGKAGADMKEFLEAGIKLDVRSFGAGPKVGFRATAASALAIFNKSPHPAASKVFINWYMTKPISEGLSKATDFNSRRADVAPADPTSAPTPGGDYIESQRFTKLPELRAEVKKWRPQ